MISNLISTLNQGARKNKYRVTIPLPNSADIDLLVHSASFPSKTIIPVDIIVRGRKASIRGETSIENTWDITFYNKKDMKERKDLLDWMDLVHSNQWDPESGFVQNVMSGVDSLISGVKNTIENPLSLLQSEMTDYQKDIIVEQLDGNGQVTFSTTLIGAFPITVGNVELGDETGEISTTSCTFAFSDIKYDVKGDGLQYSDIKNFINNI